MKINTSLLISFFLVLGYFPGAWAQVTVVKQDGTKVYLDTSEHNRTLAVGDRFKIIVSQEKLTNPKTGKELGLVNHYSAVGTITEVQPLYAVGEMPDKTKFSIGQEAVIDTVSIVRSPVQTTPVSQALLSHSPIATSSTRKIKTYAPVEREMVSAVQTDLTAFPGEEIAAVDTKGNLVLYQIDDTALKEIATYALPTGQKPLSLSAQDLKHTGYAQLFVSVYKETEQKIVTLVFDVQDNTFEQVASLPYFVKELGCADDKDLYAQKPFVQGSRAGNAHELDYENKRFHLDKEDFSTRGNWLSGIAEYEIQNKDTENFVYTASNGRLRMKLANGKFIDSPALFATAPNRVKYKQEIISFYPAVQAYGPKGRATLAAIENTTKLGLLSAQFGQYNGGKLHFLTYENGSFHVQETVDLAGFAYDTSCTNRGILIPQVLSSGQTILTEIYR